MQAWKIRRTPLIEATIRVPGDKSISHRSIMIESQANGPVSSIEGGKLRSIEYSMPIASAKVKSAILFAALFAEVKTSVIEPSQSRDHTERLLDWYGIASHRTEPCVSVVGGETVQACDLRVPGDISSAAFWLVAAAAHAGSSLRVQGVGLNPTRTAILAVLSRMGAGVREGPETAHDCANPLKRIETLMGNASRHLCKRGCESDLLRLRERHRRRSRRAVEATRRGS